MDFSKKLIQKLYREMLLIRVCEEQLAQAVLDGEVKCPTHLYSGQEANAVGLCSLLNNKDIIFGSHRSHGHFLAKGGSINELIAEIYGKETGCSKGRGGSMHLIDPKIGMAGSVPIVGGTISLALGSALGNKIRNDKSLTISFFGDGATGEGVLYESLNFAALKKLPIIFACENNLYSTHLSIKECRINENISAIANPFNIKSFSIDGNDVLKVYEVSKLAVDHCRQGLGPVFIEFKTYRYRGHVGADDNIQGSHTDIRPQSEVDKWFKKDPIKRLEKFILNKKILSSRNLNEIRLNIDKQVNDAFSFAKISPFPKKGELNKYVYID